MNRPKSLRAWPAWTAVVFVLLLALGAPLGDADGRDSRPAVGTTSLAQDTVAPVADAGGNRTAYVGLDIVLDDLVIGIGGHGTAPLVPPVQRGVSPLAPRPSGRVEKYYR